MHISSGITLNLSSLVTKRPLSNYSFIIQAVLSICLTLGVTILDSTTEMQLVLSSLCNVGAPVWSAKYSMWRQIALGIFTDLYMPLISQAV